MIPEWRIEPLIDQVFWGSPQFRDRPKTVLRRGKPYTYYPRPTFEFELFAAETLRMNWQNQPLEFDSLMMRLDIVHPRPKRRPSIVDKDLWKSGARCWRPLHPEGSRVAKLMREITRRGTIIKSESQIVDAHYRSWWSAKNEKPHVHLWLGRIEHRATEEPSSET